MGFVKSSAAKDEGISGLQRSKSEATNAGEAEDLEGLYSITAL